MAGCGASPAAGKWGPLVQGVAMRRGEVSAAPSLTIPAFASPPGGTHDAFCLLLYMQEVLTTGEP